MPDCKNYIIIITAELLLYIALQGYFRKPQYSLEIKYIQCNFDLHLAENIRYIQYSTNCKIKPFMVITLY